MDFAITSCFRLVANDLLLFWDVVRFYAEKYPDEPAVLFVQEALIVLIESETKAIDKGYDVKNGCAFQGSLDATTDFLHSIVFQFYLEELSQFIFWKHLVS